MFPDPPHNKIPSSLVVMGNIYWLININVVAD